MLLLLQPGAAGCCSSPATARPAGTAGGRRSPHDLREELPRVPEAPHQVFLRGKRPKLCVQEGQ